MDSYKKALRKIKHDQRCKPKYSERINILDPTGPQGLTGATGPAPTLTIGTVTTGAPGTSASVTITPTTS